MAKFRKAGQIDVYKKEKSSGGIVSGIVIILIILALIGWLSDKS